MVNSLIDPNNPKVLESFLKGTQGLLKILSQDLISIKSFPDNVDLLYSIFRYFHNIKGSSSFMGFNDIYTITNEAEELLYKLRRGELSINQDIIDILSEANLLINKLLERIQNSDNSPFDFSSTIAKIIQLKNSKAID